MIRNITVFLLVQISCNPVEMEFRFGQILHENDENLHQNIPVGANLVQAIGVRDYGLPKCCTRSIKTCTET